MNSKYCILSGPRSGSAFLEDIIFNNFSKTATKDCPAINLFEYLHWDYCGYHDSNHNVVNERYVFGSDMRKKFMEEMNDVIFNKNNSIVFRLFPQVWHNNYINLDEFLTKLKQSGFEFIHLNRSFKDRLLSLAVAHSTHVWHNVTLENKIYYSPSYLTTPPISTEKKIKINFEELGKMYYDNRMTDFYVNQIINKFSPSLVINYENLKEDIINAGFEIPQVTKFNKTYQGVEYKDLIENYDEVMQFIDWF